MKAEEIRRRFPRIIMNLVLTFVFLMIVAFIPQTVSNITIPGLSVNADLLVWIVGLVFIVIFLVRALADAFALVEVLADVFVGRLGVEEDKSPKRAARDLVYIIIILLLATAISPILATFKDIGHLLNTATTYIALGLIILLIYDIGRILYKIVEQKAESLADRLARMAEKTK
jgi:cation transport ATPase